MGGGIVVGGSNLEVIDPISLAVADLQNEKSYSLKMNVFEWHFSRAFIEKKFVDLR